VLDAMGWGGSALLVLSLMQARVLRFRVLNLVACVILTAFNMVLGIWPMVAMNVVLSAINLWFIVRLMRESHDEAAFDVLRVRPTDAYVGHVLRIHGADIAKFQPDFVGTTPGSIVYLVQKGDETVGVVVLRVKGGTALVDLDYVTPRFRDFSPGEFVWRQSDLLKSLDVNRVVTPPGMQDAYYDRLGFRRDGVSYVLEL
jgi:CelD/BcsL family acetyltransferase involved in cellulose biosynthesis